MNPGLRVCIERVFFSGEGGGFSKLTLRLIDDCRDDLALTVSERVREERVLIARALPFVTVPDRGLEPVSLACRFRIQPQSSPSRVR